MTLRSDSNLAGAVAAAMTSWDERRSTERLWTKDASLWTRSGEDAWLGWLDAAETPPAAVAQIEERMARAVHADIRDVILIGMGGSSLAPEVIARVLPAGSGGRTLRILDSTHPAAIHAALDRTDWPKTAIVVASKSGSTLEPDILLSAALGAARAMLGEFAPKHVVAITDPGSKLEAQAAKQGFAAVFHGDPKIGGRFSALSSFGLVHVALRGIPIAGFMKSARDMAGLCRQPAQSNPGVALGVYLAIATKAGRDKCTLVLPPSLAPLGAWIEQLIAESTGKHGKAILPIDAEPLGEPRVYGNDRAFVHVRDASGVDPNTASVDALVSAGHPVFTIDVPSGRTADGTVRSELAGEFFRWEFATAVAGALLALNPFDQPDVEAAKIATRALTDAYERGDRTPAPETSDDDALSGLIASLVPGDYFALLAFLPMFPEVEQALQRTRHRVRDAKRVATTLGFGPRFLHSTGQAFKGGPNSGAFVQLTWNGAEDIPVPSRKLTFGNVVSAQAAGDRAVLKERGRRVVHLHLKGDLESALEAFDRSLLTALEKR